MGKHTIYIRDENLWEEAKLLAEAKGISISSLIADLLTVRIFIQMLAEGRELEGDDDV